MRRFLQALALSAMAALVLGPIAAEGFGGAGQAQQVEVRHRSFSKSEIDAMARTTAVIKTGFGDIKIRFFPDLAPNHVDNFITLAKSGFYDGTVFHRVIPGFMIQGGDPKSKSPNRAGHGTGGPGHYMKAEFSGKPHKRGILSAARSANPDSAGSQFFVCVAAAPWLDRQYTVFAEVVSGMDVVDRIVSQPRDSRDNPLERMEIKVVINSPAPEAQVAPAVANSPAAEQGGK